ncbi:hypothetical protein AAMO2058_000226400, partial [Amorphochlora amoebiformis]
DGILRKREKLKKVLQIKKQRTKKRNRNLRKYKNYPRLIQLICLLATRCAK